MLNFKNVPNKELLKYIARLLRRGDLSKCDLEKIAEQLDRFANTSSRELAKHDKFLLGQGKARFIRTAIAHLVHKEKKTRDEALRTLHDSPEALEKYLTRHPRDPWDLF